MSSKSEKYPTLCVFDLDACLWTPETYELDTIPTEKDVIIGDLCGRGEGVVGLQCGSNTLRLFPSALQALQHLNDHPYPGMRYAVASSAVDNTAVAIAHKALDLLEVVPGTTLRTFLQRGWEPHTSHHLQIGRVPPLSPDKARSHFPRLRQLLGVPYEDMVFLDDCTWEDNVRHVHGKLGVIGVPTPNGLTLEHIQECVRLWRGGRGGGLALPQLHSQRLPNHRPHTPPPACPHYDTGEVQPRATASVGLYVWVCVPPSVPKAAGLQCTQEGGE